MSDLAVVVKNLSKKFIVPHEKQDKLRDKFTNPFKRIKKQKFFALNDVNFEVKKGEFVGIIGRNGSGKSTLLKILSGVYEPTSGSVWTDGSMVPFLELGVGFNPELTGRENIILNGVILGMSKEYMRAKMEEIIDFAEIREFIDMQVKNYSSGMILRLGFSIAKEVRADIYLFDEIMGVGDAHFQKKSSKELKKIIAGEKTVLLVTHDMPSIQKYCNKVVLLDKGKMIFAGDTREGINIYQQMIFEGEQNSIKSNQNNHNIVTKGYITIDKVELSKDRFVDNDDDNLTITISFTSNRNINNTCYGVSFYNDAGVLVYGTNNYNKNSLQNIEKGKHTIKAIVDVSKLLNSIYSITIGIFEMDPTEQIIFHDRMYQFEVFRSNSDIGIQRLPVDWEIVD